MDVKASRMNRKKVILSVSSADAHGRLSAEKHPADYQPSEELHSAKLFIHCHFSLLQVMLLKRV